MTIIHDEERLAEYVLDNGVRVVAEHIPWVRSTAVAIYIATGAAYEDAAQRGVSHFIEHMLFKGTARRSAEDIARTVDGVGGVLNAFTEHEYTCVYAQVMTERAELAVDIIADMLGESRFDGEEFEREKDVVIEEIKKAEDTPEDRVHGLFAETIWPGDPLGQSILGQEQAVRALSRDAVVSFFRDNYGPAGMIFVTAGSLEPGAAVELAQRYMSSLEGGTAAPPLTRPQARPGEAFLTRPTEQVNFCIGCEGLAVTDPDFWALAAVECAFGGGMSSRLFQEIREKRGLVYNIGSYMASYHAAGLLVAAGGAAPERWPAVRDLVREQADRVCREGLSQRELDCAREQIKGGMILALENTGYRARRNGTSVLYWGRVLPVTEIIDAVDAVTVDQATQVARRILGKQPMHLAVVGPRAG
jgi:predicted Zn-dependent peptidase